MFVYMRSGHHPPRSKQPPPYIVKIYDSWEADGGGQHARMLPRSFWENICLRRHAQTKTVHLLSRGHWQMFLSGMLASKRLCHKFVSGKAGGLTRLRAQKPSCPVLPFCPFVGKGSPLNSTNQKRLPCIFQGRCASEKEFLPYWNLEK